MLQMPEDLPDDQIEVWQQASEYFYRAYHRQMRGDVAGAIADYRHSVNLYPTAEGFTFLGWALSYLSLYPEAIAACKRAIALDPTFGNPYNDIGSYLVALGDEDEAVTWFKRAMRAPRY
ncbi:MAG: tetratricopeptide repeat protein, partial [Caldilinea sp.]|nr:tetratricopeptide repeat protein [Caldilinea sp.]